MNPAEVSAQIDDLGDRLGALLGPLTPAQRRRALGQLQARLEHTLPPEEQATESALHRKALKFGLGSFAFGGVLYALSQQFEALAALSVAGQAAAFVGLVALFGPLSRMLSNLLSRK